jgi:CheY-like chemotaxis protein
MSYESPRLSVSVTDNGPGFPIDFIEEFQQTQKGLSRTMNGLGVGLSVANNLLSVFGSSLSVSKNEPSGACVSFSIKAQEVQPIDSASDKALHCLVVEDNPVNLKLLQSMIHKLGHTSEGAKNGEEALQCHSKQRFDVVFMDIQMPVMDGITATRELRRRGFKAPIYAVTANTELETRHRALEAGVDDIIGKPVKKAFIGDVLAKSF